MRPEFYAWLREVKQIDAESLTDARAETELWRTFVEDFNTATLPDKKFYNLSAWEEKQAQKRRLLGAEEDEGSFSFLGDEEAVRAEQRRAREQQRRAEFAQHLQAMRADTAKVSEMTHQEELRRLQQHLWRSGDEAAVQKIADRLRPDAK